MFKIGDKVVPHQKTAKGWEGLENSQQWKEAQMKDQPYLYITAYDEEEEAWLLNTENEEAEGDFFRDEDFILYTKWEVLFIENRDDLDKRHYRKIIEWVEIHESEHGKNELVKFKEDTSDDNELCLYALRISNSKARDWAYKEHQKKTKISHHRSGLYSCDSLETLIKFNEECKRYAG